MSLRRRKPREQSCDVVKEGAGASCPAGLPVPRGTLLTRRALQSVTVLVVVVLAVAGVNLLWTAHEVRSFQSQQQAQAAEQRRDGRLVEERLCTTLGRLAALKPPTGAATANPSRAYEQELHATLAQLGPDIGCR